MRLLKIFIAIPAIIILISCATSNSVARMTNGQSLSDYKYVVYGQEVEGGSMKMTDVMFSVQNEIAKVLKEVSKQDALNISMNGERILSPRVNVNSELWDGGPILNKPSAR